MLLETNGTLQSRITWSPLLSLHILLFGNSACCENLCYSKIWFLKLLCPCGNIVQHSLLYPVLAGNALTQLKCWPAPAGDGSCTVFGLLTSEKFLLSAFAMTRLIFFFFSPSLNFFNLIAERARVGLAPLPGMKGTDYINASYIMVRKPTPNYKVKSILRC